MQAADDLTSRRIREIIARSGWHISAVAGGPVPLYAHTIGMREHRGFELLWAGGARFARNEMADIMNTAGTMLVDDGVFDLRRRRFRVLDAHPSWGRLLGKPALEYWEGEDVPFKQVRPVDDVTLDTPDLSRPYDPATSPVWGWLTRAWPYGVGKSSLVTTDLHVLTDATMTDMERWEDDLFSVHGPKKWADADLRQVPLGTLLALDPSLEPITRLQVGFTAQRARRGDAWGEPYDLLDRPVG